jgi:hypothetical protein
MIRVPPAPVVSAALSGFVVGVIVTLVATGSIGHSSAQPAVTPAPTPTKTRSAGLSDAAIAARVRIIVTRELGPSPMKSQPRLISLSVSPAERNPFHDSQILSLRTVIIKFRLNNHPLGASWRLKAAKGDVFLVLRALYTSNLPVGSVEMNGEFPLQAGTMRRVLEIYIDAETAAKLSWRKMARNEVNEGKVWRALDYAWVDPRFG